MSGWLYVKRYIWFFLEVSSKSPSMGHPTLGGQQEAPYYEPAILQFNNKLYE